MRRNIVLINLAGALLWLSMYVYVPTLSSYAASIGASVVMIGILAGIYGVMQIILRMPLGVITDKLGKDRLTLIIGFCVLTVSNILFVVQQDDINLMILARGIAGAAAAWWVVICASYTKYYPDDQQVKAQGILSSTSSAGKMIAAILCAVVAQFFGYSATFVVALVTAIIGIILMTGLKDIKRPEKEPVPLKEQLLLFKNKSLILFCVLGIFSQLVCFGVPTTFTPLAAEALGADRFTLGMLITVFFTATSLFSLFPSTGVYKRMGGIKALLFAAALQGISAIPFFYHVNLPLIFVMQACAGAGYGIIQAVLAGFVVRCVEPPQRGTATGIFQSLYSFGILLGPMITGFVAGYASLDAGYWTMGASMVAAVLLCLFIPKKFDTMT